MRNQKVTDGIRIAAGGYLIYLAWQILKDGIFGGGMTGKSYVAGIIFSIVFIVGGALIAGWSVRHLMQMRKEEQENAAKEARELEDKKAEAEDAAGVPEDKSLEAAGAECQPGEPQGVENPEQEETEN